MSDRTTATVSSNLELGAILNAVADGWVNVQKHPRADLFIYNYADRCQWENHWTPATLACRGLILDGAGNVVARPFPKFFNYDQVVGQIPNEPFEVFDKLDGSLGITYWIDGEPHIATRGSFTSPQAVAATEMLRSRYHAAHNPKHLTLLFEIIYPDNRIVVDYGDTEQLVLLAVIDTANGYELPYDLLKEWGYPLAKRFDGLCGLSDVLSHDRDNAEGFVLRFSSGFRCKVKLAEYVRLHKLLTGITPRMIWDELRSGRGIEPLIDRVPDEFYKWMRDIADGLQSDFDTIEAECRSALAGLSFPTRKDAAAYITKQRHPSILFAMLDGKPYADGIWKLLRPEASRAFRCSDTAPADAGRDGR